MKRNISLRTIFLAVLLLNMKAYALADRDVEHDLELVIRCDEKDLKRGDEIPIVFRITNKGQTAYEYDDRDADRSGRMPEYVPEARQSDGAAVADPWASRESGIGGGLTRSGKIGPGESFEKTIALNRWALVKQAGRYEVVGKYLYRVGDEQASGWSGPIPFRKVAVTSTPIEIIVGKRSAEEMGEYISSLTEALKTADPEDTREQKRRLDSIVTRLVYTCDERIAPTLIEMMYSDRRGNGAFWAYHGLRFYLPRTTEIKRRLENAAQRQGLGRCMQSVLEYYGCEEEVFSVAIRRGFESDDKEVLWSEVYAAQEYPDDTYTAKLIELALDANNPARGAAIAAIAYNRTNEGVAALKSLLKDDDKTLRTGVEYSIQQAYRRHPVRPEKIDEEYTAALTEIARDMNDSLWYGAVSQIVRTRTKEGFAALQAYLENPEERNAVLEKDEGLRAVRDLLSDSDAKMRSYIERDVRRLCKVPRGRPLRPDDFGPEFQDFDAKQKKWILGNLKEREAAGSMDNRAGPKKVDERSAKWAKKLDLAGVGNFHKVSSVLYRGQQPSAKGMKNLEKMGIKTVVNLRSFHSDRDEMKGTKMGYEHITMKAWHAEDKEIVRFLKIVTSKKNQPVLVHCQHGADRTGTMCAIYRIAVQNWTRDEAIEEMTKGGFGYHSIWKNLIDYIEALDIEKIKQKAGLKN